MRITQRYYTSCFLRPHRTYSILKTHIGCSVVIVEEIAARIYISV
jgi:hypothetical protein